MFGPIQALRLMNGCCGSATFGSLALKGSRLGFCRVGKRSIWRKKPD